MKKASPPRRKGRPPRQTAASYAAIMDAVHALLQKKSIRDLTMEEVARRARVGKPTLYKWWPTKATLVLAMLCERMAPNLEKPTVLTAEESAAAFSSPAIDRRVQRTFRQDRGRPDRRGAKASRAFFRNFSTEWVSPRRNATIADLQRGKNAGELRPETEPELLNDAIFGAIYYRLLLRLGRSVDQAVRRGVGRASHPRASANQSIVGKMSSISTLLIRNLH